MKDILLILLMLLLFQACGSQNRNNNEISLTEGLTTTQEIQSDSIKGAFLSLDKKRYDFGKISKKNTPHIPIEFTVENKGSVPLIIIKADVSCGCLSVEYPKEPISPGGKAILTVNIDTKSQEGTFNKTVFLKSNAKNDVELVRIIGEIKK